MLQLEDLSLKGFEALQAGNRHGKGIPLYYSKKEKRSIYNNHEMGCVDLSAGHGERVS